MKRRWNIDVSAAVAEYSSLFAKGIGGCNRIRRSISLWRHKHDLRHLLKLLFKYNCVLYFEVCCISLDDAFIQCHRAQSQDSLIGEKIKQFSPMENDSPAVMQHVKRGKITNLQTLNATRNVSENNFYINNFYILFGFSFFLTSASYTKCHGSQHFIDGGSMSLMISIGRFQHYSRLSSAHFKDLMMMI